MASTIAEATNNGLGMAGLAFGCAIMPVKVLDAAGEGTFFDVADGIDYAAGYTEGGAHPVKVINLSLGSESSSETLTSAIDRAVSGGVMVVAAAGNSGRSLVEFPASLSNVVAVGALDARKERAYYSNTGADLDFVAPGGDCNRDDTADGFGDCVYQQDARPRLRRSRPLRPVLLLRPRRDEHGDPARGGGGGPPPLSQGFTDPAAIRAAIEESAEDLGAPGRDDQFGFGLIRPSVALTGHGLIR